MPTRSLRTKDMGLSAWLVMEDYQLLKVELEGERQRWWVFAIDEEDDSPDEIRLAWIMSDAKKFYDALSKIKSTLGQR